MSDIYPNVNYKKSYQGDILYIDIDSKIPLENFSLDNFSQEFNYIIFRFSDTSKMASLLKLDIKKYNSNYIN